jgi:hypothetical protein
MEVGSQLNNGCICCTVRGDLSRAEASILQRGRKIDILTGTSRAGAGRLHMRPHG